MRAEPNMYEIEESCWCLFVNKILDQVPGSSAHQRYQWVEQHSGISISTIMSWSKGKGGAGSKVPSMENLARVTKMLQMPLPELVRRVQLEIDPPDLKLTGFGENEILRLAQLPEADLELLAKTLKKIPQGTIIKAISNLARLNNGYSQN